MLSFIQVLNIGDKKNWRIYWFLIWVLVLPLNLIFGLAYIQSYLVHIGQNNPELALMTFNELFQEFRNEKYGGIENIEQYQHEEMARNYVDTISSALKELFGSRFSDQFYEDLAWGGLLETDNFNNLESFSEQEKERIRNVNYNEDKGTNDSKGVNCSPSN